MNQLKLHNSQSIFDMIRFSLSHEMSAPLRTIHSFSDFIQNKYQNQLPSDVERVFNLISHSCVEINNLVQALLGFLKITQHPIKIEEINIDKLVNAEIAKQIHSQASVEIKQHRLPKCMADNQLIAVVIENLISNAIKFSCNADNPTIEIGYQEHHDEIIYFIRDNGIGFDMQYINKLFKPFQKLHHEPRYCGVGLGLTITKWIIDLHQGKIWAESMQQQTTFYFQLNF
ncbi:MAG: hypothetical protein JSS07_01080 [Proteobacteria bacterium]|nr:hypothetical protein [Pseudomonadota bacterium]